MKIKHNTIILIILLALVSSLALYQSYYIKTIKAEYKNNNDSIIKKEVPTEESLVDSYQNGTFPGIVTFLNKDKGGNLIVGIDFVQTFEGRKAFLALAEDYDLGKNKLGNWDTFKSAYPTFKDLKEGVLNMSEEQFEDFFFGVDSSERSKNGGIVPGGILGSFPNGFTYTRNESSKIREFKISSEVKDMTITNSDKIIPIASAGEVQGIKDFTIEQGVVTGVQIVYRP